MDEKKLTESLNLAASELFIAPTVSIGAVLCAEKFLPHQMSTFKRFLANRIIEPHLGAFEKFGGHVFKAYDTQNKKEFGKFPDVEPELPNKPYRELSLTERTYKIADILTKVGLAFIVEGGASFASQHLLNKVLGTHIKPLDTVRIDVSAHAIALGSFMTFLAPAVETVKDGVAKILVKAIGMEEKEAKDTARILTYVNVPGWLAFLATWKFGLSKNGHQK